MSTSSSAAAMKRIDIVSDTHGYLSPELVSELAGADLIVHAGDIVHAEDLRELERIAPVHAVLGNNDYFANLPPHIKQEEHFTFEGIRFFVTHIKSAFSHPQADVLVFGHTHRPYIEQAGDQYEINPGSPTFPRSDKGPTMARLWVKNKQICSAELVTLPA